MILLLQELNEAEQLKQEGNKLYAADDLEAAVVCPSFSYAAGAQSAFTRSFGLCTDPQSCSCACKLLLSQVYVQCGNVRRRKHGMHLQAKYEQALQITPEGAKKQRAVYYANLAACHLRTKHFEDAVQDSNAALELEPDYIKALLRRAAAYEELDDLEHAMADNTKVSLSRDMQPTMQ